MKKKKAPACLGNSRASGASRWNRNPARANRIFGRPGGVEELVGWLVGCLDGWMVGWLVGW